MKKILLVSCALLITLSLCNVIYAQEAKAQKQTECASTPVDTADMRYNKSPINKLGRGVANTATCWLEIPAEACRVTEEKGPLVGYTLGIVEGFFTTLLRGATGIFDAVTFLIPPYDKPFMQPEYAIDSFGDSFKSNADAEQRAKNI